jgi:hypothetical protein
MGVTMNNIGKLKMKNTAFASVFFFMRDFSVSSMKPQFWILDFVFWIFKQTAFRFLV